MLLMFSASVALLAIGIRFSSIVSFYRHKEFADDSHVSEGYAALPLVLIFMLVVCMASFPGAFFESYLSPAISSIINRGEIIDVAGYGGQEK